MLALSAAQDMGFSEKSPEMLLFCPRRIIQRFRVIVIPAGGGLPSTLCLLQGLCGAIRDSGILSGFPHAREGHAGFSPRQGRSELLHSAKVLRKKYSELNRST